MKIMDLKVVSILLVGILVGGSVGYLYLKPQMDRLTAEIEDHEERYESLSQLQGLLQQEHESLSGQFETISGQYDALFDQFNDISGQYEELSNVIDALTLERQEILIELEAISLEREELIDEIRELRFDLAGKVKINEILYNPLGADEGNEWVELFNSGESAVDLAGWTVSGSDGSVKATLPSIIFPPDHFLIVHFGPEEPGMYELTVPSPEDPSAFPDEAYYFVGTLDEIFDNDGDSVALYMGEPSAETIIDYVAWNSKSNKSIAPPLTITIVLNVAEGYASDAGIWTRGTYLDTSYANENFVLRGETIGRTSASADTDSPEDWSDNGGSDAWGPTEGWSNSGPLYTYDVGLFISQYDINTVLWEYGFSVEKVTAPNIQVTDSEETLSVTIDYEFTVEIYGYSFPFRGICTHNWNAINETSYVVTTDIHLTSDLGESFTLNSQRYETGVDTKNHKSQRTLSATYIDTGGLAYPYSYTGTRTIKHIASDVFRTDDIRSVLGLDGINRVANSTVIEVVNSDTTSSFTLDAIITSGLEEPETMHMETFIEMDGDRQFDITIPVYTKQSKGYEFSLLEPATIEFKRVSGEPRDSFGRYEYISKTTLGNPELGYATITVNLYEDYTKIDGKPIIRGEVSASLNGYDIITRKYYIYDWWRRALRTGLRIVSATAWAVGCFAGATAGAPTCVGKAVAVGACAAGMAATDSLVSDLVTEKK